MNSYYSIRNVLEKGNRGQVIVLVAGIIIVILLTILMVLLINGETSNDNKQNEGGNVEMVQNGATISTDYNENHEYTLNEYLPWTNYDYLEDGSGVEVKYNIEENTAIPKGIVVTVSGCDEEVNKTNANAYLSTIPVDLDDYEISYIVEECER